jgi:uncharacterized protein YjbI with pentapeptide repeats
MVKKDQDLKLALIKKLKLKKSFNKVLKISEPRERELQKAIEAEKFAKDKDLSTDTYLDLLDFYERTPSIFRKFRQNKLIQYILSSLAGTALLTLLVERSLNYISQRQAQTEQYQQQLITKYLDDIKEILLKQSQNNSTQSNNLNIAENLARVKTITTIQQLDKKRKEDLLGFLIEAKLISKSNNPTEEENSVKTKTISLNTSVQKPKPSSLQKQNPPSLQKQPTSSTPGPSQPIHISLSNADLKGVDLKKTNLSGADLSGADLSGADLSGADLSDANLSGANLSGANLSKTNLRYASLRYADLNNAILGRADLKEARLREANLEKADLTKSNLLKANLVGVNLIEANLTEANLQDADLIGANLFKAKLKFTKTQGTNFLRVNRKEAILEDHNLETSENFNKTSVSTEKPESICGPHTSTYAVFNPNKEFIGVRCVLINDIKKQSSLANKSPKLVWYGEGRIKDKPYQLIGQAFFTDENYTSLTSSISNIYNEQEQNEQEQEDSKKSSPDSSIYLHIKMKENWEKPQEIFLKQKSNLQETLKEIWILQYDEIKKSKTLEQIKNYQPLEQVNNCGSQLQEYTVYPILMRRTWRDSSWNNPFLKLIKKESPVDWGIRCIFPEDVPRGNGSNTTTWFGTGIWEGRPYYHLGTQFNKGHGAVDICGFYKKQNKDKDKEPYCYKVDSGLLKLKSIKSTSTSKSSGFDIEKEWSEKWRN